VRKLRKVPGEATPDELLAAFGALEFALAPGAFAYILGEHDGRGGVRWFYAGETEDLLTRIGAHAKTYGYASDGGRLAAVKVVPCRDRHQARVTQFVLIDRLDLDNQKGTAEYEEYRRTVHAARRMDQPAHVSARRSSNGARRAS
jgi:hypothetical protein